MIHIDQKPEPVNFNEIVRIPGNRWVASVRKPTAKQFQSHAYWTEILRQLYDCYDRVCAFVCHWIPSDTGYATVEHFKPKTKYPELAYEWSNFRLVSGRLNGRKHLAEDVLDPFEIRDGMFAIDFASMCVEPVIGLSSVETEQVKTTIKRLRLNDDSTCVEARWEWFKVYLEIAFESAQEQRAFKWLQKKAPFIAKELQRQQLRNSNRLKDLADRL